MSFSKLLKILIGVSHLVVERLSYLQQFSPALIAHLQFEAKGERATHLLKAIELLYQMNQQQKRKLPDNAFIEFLPKHALAIG